MSTISSLVAKGHPLLGRLGVVFDVETRSLGRGGRSRHLAPREAKLLATLMDARPGRVVSRNDLLDAVWGNGEVCEDALTVIVSRLRRHFDRLGIDVCVIETVPRRGYRLSDGAQDFGGFREARRDVRLGRVLGVAALVLSALAMGLSSLALLLALH